jgi:Rad52/22 family double-strand break repair protein
MSTTSERAELPARTHAQAAELFRRPFAPGAIGFRAMMKVPLNGDPFGGAQVAAYIGAQSVLQRLNAVVPGHWRQEFKPVEPSPGSKRLYMACRLIITLPITEGGSDLEAVYEDVGEMDGASRAGLKALYSDARKRAAVAAGIGAYLYTALEPVVLPIGPNDRQVQLIRRSGKPDMLALSPTTEQWLRHGYKQRMSTEAVRRDLGEILSHGEPDRGMGQGEATEQPAEQSPGQAFWDGELAAEQAERTDEAAAGAAAAEGETAPKGNGVVVVDFRGLGPDAA